MTHQNPTPANQFVFTPAGSHHSIVITHLTDSLYCWQVIRTTTGHVETQGECEGFDAKTNALSQAINAHAELRRGEA